MRPKKPTQRGHLFSIKILKCKKILSEPVGLMPMSFACTIFQMSSFRIVQIILLKLIESLCHEIRLFLQGSLKTNILTCDGVKTTLHNRGIFTFLQQFN